MAAMAGILQHQAHAASSAAAPRAMDSTSSDQSADTTVSANDFLTLLVTELQNQDPTADTDPNAYITQLVQVNSLEQLISINQTLTSATSDTSSTADARSAVSSASSPSSIATGSKAAAATQAATNGNLSVPKANPAAQRVAESLNGAARKY